MIIINTDMNSLSSVASLSKTCFIMMHFRKIFTERKIDFRFAGFITHRKSGERALVPVLLRISHCKKIGSLVSLSNLSPPCWEWSARALTSTAVFKGPLAIHDGDGNEEVAKQKIYGTDQ